MAQSDYKNITIPFFSKDEQNKIVTYLDKKCNEIDQLIFDKEKLLFELESFKKSMIYEYVTGKKQVQ
jgi:type I restriction enzyme S subunit